MIVGLDMGGTNVDAVVIDEETGTVINAVKNPADYSDLFSSICTTLDELLSGFDKTKINRINLSTTVSTNAIIEGKTSPVGTIIQSGPGLSQDYLCCAEVGGGGDGGDERDEKVFISGYIDHRGKVIKDLNIKEIEEGVKKFQEKNINYCAVITKFSTRNPNHELIIKNLLSKNNFSFITMGHSVSGMLNFPRRISTSYLNSAVHKTFKYFSDNIKKYMDNESINAPLYILKADGGTTSLSEAEDNPVETILSGPAASFMGLNAMLHTGKDAVLIDIGGTTTDIFFLADGVPLFEPLGIEIGFYKTLVRAIYSVSIGLGGDSGISILNGEIKIGPEREGKPYAYGGPKPTPTDAMIVLGLLLNNHGTEAIAGTKAKVEVLAEDEMETEAIAKTKARAVESIKIIGEQLNMTAENAANKILSIMGDIIKNKVDELLVKINSRPVYTVKELLYGKKLKPEIINIIGGPAAALSLILEKKFNMPCYYPDNHHVANAIGAALARITTEITIFADTSQKRLTVPELGISEEITKNFTLDNAKERAKELLKEKILSQGAKEKEIAIEITEASSFNMVRGFYTSGRNIRVKAQVKPGLICNLKGAEHD